MSDSCADPKGSVGAFLCRAGQHLRAAAIPQPRMEARMLLARAMGVTQEALLRDPRAPVPEAAAAPFAEMLRRRLDGAPMAYLTGSQGFWTLDLATSPDTLIPRADTETLVEAALELFPQRAAVGRILDLGTGTGAILLAALAARNARRNALGDRCAFLAGSWAEALAGRFDLILSNPPYIESAAIAGLMPEVARHEPLSALDGGPDGLVAYRALAGCLLRLLAPEGRAVLELGQGQEPAVAALMRDAGLRVPGARQDLGGIARALIVAP
ncbi:N5-glutamine methyltransferase family protein [Roseomonas mucosa]|uniref:N5-glutamine methyltransferase family protein n=1 Tax=Roseomonas mucosa TaxID=207340 RepID=UPI001EF5D100|nr:HemK/PrmC family methyltransferase [Roseomonas mucosa]MCG7353729.1 peptide chain release factor N(5)-glutamine methyltransferase [Roseomonas mucosa]